ncbi:MAG TPA: RHS repeat-associated core domain-containing protein [Pseudothauera hydrothermalis]|nr:RHS repeat-associated core domain-containing protein [Pseudothauera hydrothermalis]
MPLLSRAAEPRSAQSLFADGFESTNPPASTWQFTYDPFNRLSAITGPGLSAGYTIAATGLRVEKTVNGTTTRFVYGMNGQLLHERGTSTNRRTQYLYLNGKPIAFVRNNGPGNGNALYHLHTDHLGRPERITNAANTIVWRARLAAFNHSVTLDQIGGYHLGFPGQYHDTETGFAYNIHRDYDPATGRYLQSDPIGLNGGINTYAYAEGNPVMMADPLGLEGVGYWNNGAMTNLTGGVSECEAAAFIDSALNITPFVGMKSRCGKGPLIFLTMDRLLRRLLLQFSSGGCLTPCVRIVIDV